MITSIRVGNFKAFEKIQNIPVRPLTLIYGANSSGKSSVLHSLTLARHAQETGDLDIYHTDIGGEAVDLGGFGQFIHRKDVKRRLEWAVELDASAFTESRTVFLAQVRQLLVSLSVGIPLDDRGYPSQDAVPEIYSYEISGDEQSFMRMSRRRDGKLRVDQLDSGHPAFQAFLENLMRDDENVQVSDLDYADELVANIAQELDASVEVFLPEGLTCMGDLSSVDKSYLYSELNEIVEEISQAIQKEMNRLQYLGPLRSYPPRHLAFLQRNDPDWNAGGGYAWDVIRRDVRVRNRINEWLSSPDRLQTPYEMVVRRLVDIDRLDESLAEGLEQLNDEGLGLELDGPYEDMEGQVYPVIENVDAQAARLRDIIQSSDIEKLSELIMIDRRSNTTVSHRDVGIGISQVLPVLASAYAARNKIIAIEQPEIHLHPALQADIGDVFLQSALGESKNRFLIETHSEHLLLRVMRRMRETSNGNLPEGVPEVTPADVCVLFVQPKGTSSAVRHLELDAEGRLLDAWPGGFFEEGFRERFA